MAELATNRNIQRLSNTANTQLVFQKHGKKCWICLNLLELEPSESLVIKELFFAKNICPTPSTKSKRKANYVQLKILFNRIVLSACKCRKKLAHVSCFNNFIDLKQNGNINIQIECAQCNFKYEFVYPYNCMSLQLLDFLDQSLNASSNLLTVGVVAASTYWCSLSFGILTILQIYGFDKGVDVVSNSNFLFSAIFLPLIPVVLVLARFTPCQNTIEKMFPTCLKYKQKQNKKTHNEESDDDDDEEKLNSKFISKIRLIVGGLMLPTIAVSLDRLVFGTLGFKGSSLLRTTLVGLAFIGLKGASKVVYCHKKLNQEEMRDIKDFKL